VAVVVVFELVQHGCGVSLVDDQEAVEEFAADCPDEAFRDGIRPRCPHRRPDDLDVDGGEGGVEGGGEPAVAVADEEPEAAVGVVEVDQQVAGLLGESGAGRVVRCQNSAIASDPVRAENPVTAADQHLRGQPTPRRVSAVLPA